MMRRKISGLLAAFLTVSILLSSCGPRDVETSSTDSSSGSEKVDAASYNSLVVAEDFNEVKSVKMGGGGSVTGIVIHPLDPDLMYIRTDVGGAYRWEADTEEWIPLCEAMTHSSYTYIDGIAVDPNDVNVVYICAGNGYPSDVLKSTDQGETWERTKISTQFKGNQSGKQNGECIQVDPNNSNVIVCGTRDAGLHVSLDGAATWTKVQVLEEGQNCQIRSVAIDKTSARNGRSQVIYVSITDKGIYKTADAGETWTLLNNSPTEGNPNLSISNNGKLVAANAEGVFSLVGNTFEAITPDVDTASGYDKFKAIAIDPNNSNKIVCSTTITKADGTASPHQLPILYSDDGGKTWTDILHGAVKNLTVPWWPAVHYASNLCDFAFKGNSSLYFTDWYGTWGTDNLSRNTSEVKWTTYCWGHEEMVTFGAITTPAEEMIVMFTQADNSIIKYTDTLEAYPAKENAIGGQSQFLDYCTADPKFIAAAGGTSNSGKAGAVKYTTDLGDTWNSCDGWDSKIVAHNVAVCSETSSIFVAIGVNSAPYYSYNRGRTWQKSSGAPSNTILDYWSRQRVLISDKNKGNYFYLLARDGFYRSEDWGKTWTCINEDVLIPSSNSGAELFSIEGHPGKLWVHTTKACYYSEDYGETFIEIEGLGNGDIAIGKGKEDGELALWFLGTIGTNSRAVYYSLDNGATFTKVTDYEKFALTKYAPIFADCKKFGRIYMGSAGRGWLYMDITADDE